MSLAKLTAEGDSPQRQFAVEVVTQLRTARHEALWAGGCVRDALVGRAPKDYDVATSATPDEVREVFGRRRTIPIGAAFGVITVLGPQDAGQIEVATFRTDGGYSDGRRPDGVQYSDARHDASRRDFTINGLFYDPLADEVIDYVGGRQDLKERVVRAIGDPNARLAEDKLRMLRAVRFAAAYDFQIESATRDAIASLADQITVVSEERIGAELDRMLRHASRAWAMGELRSLGLLPHVLPELGNLDDTTFDERCKVLGRLSVPSLPLALAAALPEGTRSPAGSTAARRLRFTGKVGKQTDWLLDNRELATRADRAPWPQVQRALINADAGQLVEFCEAELGGASEATQFCRKKLALPAVVLNPPLLLSGADLIAAGVRPGPSFGQVLESVRDEQLEGHLTTQAEALAFAKSRL